MVSGGGAGGWRRNAPTAGRRRQIFRRKLLGPGGALSAFGGLRLVEEVGRVLAAGLAAIDAETVTCCWVVLDRAGFAASTVGLA